MMNTWRSDEKKKLVKNKELFHHKTCPVKFVQEESLYFSAPDI